MLRRREVPVRRVRHHGKNIISAFPSIKNAGPVATESTIERDFCFLLEYWLWVKRYVPQPFTITAPFADGSHHSATPDFWVDGGSRRLIVECKPARKLSDQKVQRQIDIERTFAAENDHTFLLVTDEQLRRDHYLWNVKLLYRYSRLDVWQSTEQQLSLLVGQHPEGVRLGALKEALRQSLPQRTRWTVLYTMLFRHLLEPDMTRRLSDESRVWLPGAAEVGLTYGALALQ
jgi:hypothetical protein